MSDKGVHKKLSIRTHILSDLMTAYSYRKNGIITSVPQGTPPPLQEQKESENAYLLQKHLHSVDR